MYGRQNQKQKVRYMNKMITLGFEDAIGRPTLLQSAAIPRSASSADSLVSAASKGAINVITDPI